MAAWLPPPLKAARGRAGGAAACQGPLSAQRAAAAAPGAHLAERQHRRQQPAYDRARWQVGRRGARARPGPPGRLGLQQEHQAGLRGVALAGVLLALQRRRSGAAGRQALAPDSSPGSGRHCAPRAAPARGHERLPRLPVHQGTARARCLAWVPIAHRVKELCGHPAPTCTAPSSRMCCGCSCASSAPAHVLARSGASLCRPGSSSTSAAPAPAL